MHETELRPGSAPHPPHRHKHSEFWLVRKGTVEITIKGKPNKLGPGSAAFAASNDEHGIKNVGDVVASYFVVAIGPMS
jgi:quercetin dioxygenase-like cupin family protein